MSEEDRPSDEHDALRAELRGLGRGIRIPDVDGETMAERVLAQLLAEAVPVPAAPGRMDRLRAWTGRARTGRAWRWTRSTRWTRFTRGRWGKALAVGLSGLLVVLVLTPPVRATVADWFGFGGVQVRYDPSASPPPGAPVPGCHKPVPPAEAERRAGFRARLPGELGEPDAVSVTEGPEGSKGSEGRSMVTLCWSEPAGIIRLDEFPAELDFGFAKQARIMPQWLQLAGGETAMWFAEPHLLRFGMRDARGEVWTESERTAGPTLLWGATDGRTTLRLEGVASLQRAREIAESTP